jgi:hypothetical protein
MRAEYPATHDSSNLDRSGSAKGKLSARPADILAASGIPVRKEVQYGP